MRQVTFELSVPIAMWAAFQLVPTRTLTEESLCGREPFDALVGHLKRLGCRYKVTEAPEPVLIEGDASLENHR